MVDDTLSDVQLIKLISEDNETAFEIFYNRYSSDMFMYAVKILGDRDSCKDIVQNIFIAIWTNRKTLKIDNCLPYLLQSTRYKIFNHLRNSRIKTDDLTRLNIIDASMNSGHNLELQDLHNIIEEQVQKLPPKCQHIFYLSRVKNNTIREISEELKISKQAVKNQISKALKTIRQHLIAEEVIFLCCFFSMLP